MYQLRVNVFKIILLISLGFQVVYADKVFPVLAISNGVKAAAGQLPYQVALKKMRIDNGLYYTFCGASIIGINKILSAAHCLFPKKLNHNEESSQTPPKIIELDKLYAVAGTLMNIGEYRADKDAWGEQWRRIYTTYVPNGYNFPKYDIAVMITSEPFVFSLYVNELPYATLQTDYGAIKCTASGYGRVSLSGDSGGPLVCRNTGDPNEGKSGVIVGIVSGAREYCGSFFTRVSNYKEFIESCF